MRMFGTEHSSSAATLMSAVEPQEIASKRPGTLPTILSLDIRLSQEPL